MEFFRIHKTIPFMHYSHILNAISLVSFIVAVFWIFYHGLALSIEFTGGTQVVVQYPEAVQTEQNGREAADGRKYFVCPGNGRKSSCRGSGTGHSGSGNDFTQLKENIDDTGNKTERLRNRKSESRNQKNVLRSSWRRPCFYRRTYEPAYYF